MSRMQAANHDITVRKAVLHKDPTRVNLRISCQWWRASTVNVWMTPKQALKLAALLEKEAKRDIR